MKCVFAGPWQNHLGLLNYYEVGIELASFEAISATSTKAYKISLMYLQH